MKVPSEQLIAPHTTSKLAEKKARNYLLLFVLLPAIVVVFPFIVERLAAFQTKSISASGQVLDYGSRLNGENADFVIFGDSAALYAIDDVRLSQEIRGKAITIPGTMGSLPVTGDKPLRRYLAGNRPPRAIILYFSHAGMNFKYQPNTSVYEGDEQIIRHGTLGEIVELAKDRPTDVLQFPLRFYVVSSRITSWIGAGRFVPQAVKQGHLPYPDHKPLRDGCVIPPSMRSIAGTASVQELIHDFSTQKTKILVYLAAVPDCLHSAEINQQMPLGLDAASPAVLPHAQFADDGAYVHVLPEYTDAATDTLANVIKEKLDR